MLDFLVHIFWDNANTLGPRASAPIEQELASYIL